MILESKALNDITESDLQSLVDNEIAETKTLDYKRDLYGTNKEAKKEFLADISAFANTSGGFLLIGIDEESGIATDVCGCEVEDIDAQILTYENQIRDTVDPRISGIEIQGVEVSDGKCVIIFKIPQSWNKPHMVKSSSRFFQRNSAGKYPLDVTEIRNAFLMSNTMSEQIKSFRDERISKIINGDTPVIMPDMPKFTIHILPLESLTLQNENLTPFVGTLDLPPIAANSGWFHRLNFDGFLNYSQFNDEQQWSYSYSQFFRNGFVESSSTRFFVLDKLKMRVNFEKETLSFLKKVLHTYENKLSITPPVLVFLSVTGIKGYSLWYSQYTDDGCPSDRANLLVQDILIDDFNSDLDTLMLPAFEAIWNAFGLPTSTNYDPTTLRFKETW